jgi:TPR repeat protein
MSEVMLKESVGRASQLKQDADRGDSSAQFNYGNCLKNGKGVSKDLKEAARYYKMSADQGNAHGQNNYGDCLRNGEGVSKDLKEAARYFKMSADQGNEDARKMYDELRKDLISDMKDYKVVKDLGEGKFGVVRLVEHRVSGKQLAVKYIGGVQTLFVHNFFEKSEFFRH